MRDLLSSPALPMRTRSHPAPRSPAVLLAAVLPLLLPVAGGAQADPGAVLEAASARYRAVGAVCARFEQELTIPLLETERTSRGELCQRRPNLFSMTFTEPAGDRVVADGSYFWIWFRSDTPNQVMQLPVDPERGGMDFYREFLDDPLTKYHLTGEGVEGVEGIETRRILLEPRMDRGYESATVWIDPATDLIRRVEIRESNGSIRRLTLSEVRLDPEIPAGTFRFELPEGVRVISAGGEAAARGARR